MDDLNEETLKLIIARRDIKYDGRFFFGVKTTKIYCRPICPAKPKAQNIVIFKSAAEAEREGYRPCLRCHPEFAPESIRRDGTFNTVARALKLLEEESEKDLDLTVLASRLGISDRHLRRLFVNHLGASPVEILTSKRLHLAYSLICDSRLPISEIGFGVGFQSLRRFNEAFKSLYHYPPKDFRSAKTKGPSDNGIRIILPVVAPYDFKHVLAYLKRHEAFGIEHVSDQQYVRYIPNKKSFGTIKVKQKSPEALEIIFSNLPLTSLRQNLRSLKNLLDTEHHPEHLSDAGKKMANGVRVPGSFNDFETIVSIILSQLVSIEQAKAKLKQIIIAFGKPIGKDGDEPVFAFPEPEILSRAKLEEIGMTKIKAQAIRDVALKIKMGVLNTREAFSEIKGIGPWTVEIIAMRCLRDPDAFPKSDLIIRRTLKALKISEQDWSPHRAYLTHSLWRDHGGKKP